MKSGLFRACAAMALSLVMVAAPSTMADAKGGPVVGQPAPDFELTLMDGTKVTSTQLKGQVVVLNFWATWCVPCRAELPTLDRYYAVQGKHGLKVFAITTENSLPLSRLKGLFNAMSIPAVRRIKGPYGPLTGVPTNFIIDRAGKVRYAKAGAFDLDDLNTILVPLLKEDAPA
jgi:thiol-disulfide isomerase/thioredoxin